MSKCPIPWDKTFDKDKKYIWVSETGKNTCDDCKSLDGKIFWGDKVPLRPHPNCKCEVKEYSDNGITRKVFNYSLDKVSNIKNDDIFSFALVSGAEIMQYNEATNFWKLWYDGFDNLENIKYIQKNGYVFNTINSINNPDIERKIYELLPKYVDKKQVKGIFFYDYSEPALSIKKDEQFQKLVICENKNRLLLQKTGKEKVLEFSDLNLYLSYGNVYIMNIFINNLKELSVLVVDVYDFNDNDKRKIVQRANKIQKEKEKPVYFTITNVKYSEQEWKNILNRL